MDSQWHQTPNTNNSGDHNQVAITGTLLRDPELFADPSGELLTTIVLSCQSLWQKSLWGSYGQQSHLLDVVGVGTPAEQLATMEPGTQISVIGSLDYLHRQSAHSTDTPWVLVIRATTVGILNGPAA